MKQSLIMRLNRLKALTISATYAFTATGTGNATITSQSPEGSDYLCNSTLARARPERHGWHQNGNLLSVARIKAEFIIKFTPILGKKEINSMTSPKAVTSALFQKKRQPF